MADTIQGVLWELHFDGDRKTGFLRLSPHWEFPPKQSEICTTILHQHFPITQPVWYGVWMVGTLTVPQVLALQNVFDRCSQLRSFHGATEFIGALSTVASQEGEMRVSLVPLGHVDFGIYTIFAHCPRCKYRGDFPRWEPAALSKEPINCKMCEYSFIPADTYSREWKLGTASCDNCSFSIKGKELSDEDYRLLGDWETYQSFVKEAERYDTPQEKLKGALGILGYSPKHRRPWVYQRIRELESELSGKYVYCPSCTIGHLFLKNSF